MHDFTAVQYFGPYWRADASPHPDDYLDIDFSFEVPKDDKFWCELSAELAIAAITALEPEFAAEDVELEKAITLICEQT